MNLKTCGENHPDTASSYNNLAQVYQEKGELETALDFYNKTLTIKLSTVGDSHPHVASCYNNIGNIYADRKQLDLALEQYKISLELRLKIFGEHRITTWL